jgi:lysozyme family protein
MQQPLFLEFIMVTPTEESIILETISIESGIPVDQLHELSLTTTAGGYTNDPDDPGGETNWGITQKTYTGLGYPGKVKDLTFQQAYEFYAKTYYIKSGAHRVITIHPWLAKLMFNFGVHSGYKRAIRLLQHVLNQHNNRGKHYPDLVEDGLIGDKTVQALEALLQLRGDLGEAVIFLDYSVGIGSHYNRIIENNPTLEKYRFGWSKRLLLDVKAYYQSLTP